MPGALVKGLFVIMGGMPIPFLYNPSEIADGRTVEYEELSPLGVSHAVHHYKHGKSDPITFTMTATDRLPYIAVNVPLTTDAFIGLLEDLTYPVMKAGQMVSGPPEVLFIFGAYTKYAKVKSIKVVRKQFSEKLLLERADISVTLQEVVRTSRNRINTLGI